ncbi:MAG: hypothetical protein IKS63_02615 [Firmicutes bacterium]|nr:hypothetical protein [Bacillota bacterium]
MIFDTLKKYMTPMDMRESASNRIDDIEAFIVRMTDRAAENYEKRQFEEAFGLPEKPDIERLKSLIATFSMISILAIYSQLTSRPDINEVEAELRSRLAEKFEPVLSKEDEEVMAKEAFLGIVNNLDFQESSGMVCDGFYGDLLEHLTEEDYIKKLGPYLDRLLAAVYKDCHAFLENIKVI